MRLALLVALSLVACVDGKTPDCSTPQSGCFPGDGGSNPTSDASDGATDAATSDGSASAGSSSDGSNDAATD